MDLCNSCFRVYKCGTFFPNWIYTDIKGFWANWVLRSHDTLKMQRNPWQTGWSYRKCHLCSVMEVFLPVEKQYGISLHFLFNLLTYRTDCTLFSSLNNTGMVMWLMCCKSLGVSGPLRHMQQNQMYPFVLPAQCKNCSQQQVTGFKSWKTGRINGTTVANYLR